MFEGVLARLRDPSRPVCTAALAAPHAGMIEAVDAFASVQNFPDALVDWLPVPASRSERPCVRGLDDALASAFATGSALGPLARHAEPALASA